MTQLRQRMLEDMQIRNFSENTRQSYLQQVSLFARYFRRSPEGLGPANIRTYQVLDTTNVYAEIDLQIKAEALSKCEITANTVPSRRWRQPEVMAFLRTI